MHDDQADDPTAVFVPSPELIRLYLQQTVLRIGDMRSALATGNNALLARAAHTLKGNSSYVAAHAVGELGGQIEQRVNDGPATDLLPLIDKLEAAFNAIRPALLAAAGDLSV